MGHIELTEKGNSYHENRKYKKALGFFERAYKENSLCPCTIYNLANSLYMNDRSAEAVQYLECLLSSSIEKLRDGCSCLHNTKSYQNDAYYLMFLVQLEITEDWAMSYPYAEEHLKRRKRGIPSLWTKKEVLHEISGQRECYSS